MGLANRFGTGTSKFHRTIQARKEKCNTPIPFNFGYAFKIVGGILIFILSFKFLNLQVGQFVNKNRQHLVSILSIQLVLGLSHQKHC